MKDFKIQLLFKTTQFNITPFVWYIVPERYEFNGSVDLNFLCFEVVYSTSKELE